MTVHQYLSVMLSSTWEAYLYDRLRGISGSLSEMI